MSQGELLRELLLNFRENAEAVRLDISAIAHTPDGYLWIGSDELTTLERLSATAPDEYGNHQPYLISDYLNLPDPDAEIDIEGMTFSDGYLWLVGSHSTKRKKVKGKDAKKAIENLLEIETDPNRYLLARLPIVEGVPVKKDKSTGLTAAALKQNAGSSSLTEALRQDEHIGPFLQMRLPAKENGLDIEALAAQGHRLFLGLRGPVIGAMAIILEIELKECSPGVLKLKELENNRLYRKHFVDLNGLGIRDLCFQGEDLIILAGPTMPVAIASQLFRLKNVLAHQQDTFCRQSPDQVSDRAPNKSAKLSADKLSTDKSASGELTKLFDLPFPSDGDNAEGITLWPLTESSGREAGLLVVYDSPSADRLRCDRAIVADVFRLP